MNKLLKWINDLDLEVDTIQDSRNDFHLRVKPKATEKNIPWIDIVHPQAQSKYLVLAVGVVIPEETQKSLLGLSKDVRNELLWKIRFRILEVGIDFRIVNPEIELPNIWELSTKMAVEGSSAQVFNDLYTRIKNAAYIVGWSYTQANESIRK